MSDSKSKESQTSSQRWWLRFVGAMPVLVIVACAPGAGTPSAGEVAPGQPQWASVATTRLEATPDPMGRGERLYGVRCAICHGQHGEGDGPASLYLGVAPRDFTHGAFKFRTTASGTPPTDEDLFRTITAGFPAYGMPAFDYLGGEDLWALTFYVQSLSERFAEDEPSESLVLGDPPGVSDDRIRLGREVFEKVQCGKCHGEDGRGYGPSAEGLQDSSGRPIRTLDLGSYAIFYKGGAGAADIMRTFSTGLNGTPMPSYLGAGISDDELWSLAYYVESLVGSG